MAASQMITSALLIMAGIELVLAFPCDFNKEECECYSGDVWRDFTFVTCISKNNSLIKFDVPPGTHYTVDTVTIKGNVADLPPSYFSPFTQIDELNLYQTGPATRQQTWDQSVFAGCKVDSLETHGLEGMFPLPPALIDLGSRGLTFLQVNQANNQISLGDNAFKGFTSLNTLVINNVPIPQITNKAFDGLENTLSFVTMVNVRPSTQKGPSFIAFTKLHKLTNLHLEGTGITDLPANTFSSFVELLTLELSYDNLTSALNAGALKNLPSKLTTIQLIHSGLTTVPKITYSSQQNQPLSLSLYYNGISKINANDFAGVTYSSVNLGSNPITSIEKGAVFSGDVSLENTRLTSVDLASLASATSVSVSHIYATVVNVSQVDQTFKLQRISVNPGLQQIDPKVENVFIKYPNFVLDASHNQYVKCQSLKWMAKYVLCTNNVLFNEAMCGDEYNTLVYDYFKSIGYKCNSTL